MFLRDKSPFSSFVAVSIWQEFLRDCVYVWKGYSVGRVRKCFVNFKRQWTLWSFTLFERVSYMALWMQWRVQVSPGVDCFDSMQLWSLGKKILSICHRYYRCLCFCFSLGEITSNKLCSVQSWEVEQIATFLGNMLKRDSSPSTEDMFLSIEGVTGSPGQ